MYNVYVWHYQPYLLNTFHNEALANEVMCKIKEINPRQKVWIETLGIKYELESSIVKYNELKKDLK